ncbi:MAG: GyrI-like domain-containing protein [Myxococcota bacterium]
MDFQCTIEEQQARPTLCVKTHAPVTAMATVLGQAFSELMGVISAQGAQVVGAPYVAYRNMDMNDLDMEIGFPVSRPVEGRGRAVPGSLPAGAWASTLHVGPYDKVGPAWAALERFITATGHAIGGPGYEFYFDGPETPPAQTRTRISFPLRN